MWRAMIVSILKGIGTQKKCIIEFNFGKFQLFGSLEMDTENTFLESFPIKRTRLSRNVDYRQPLQFKLKIVFMFTTQVSLYLTLVQLLIIQRLSGIKCSSFQDVDVVDRTCQSHLLPFELRYQPSIKLHLAYIV